MKIKYICDYCGKEYDNKVACSECENAHQYFIKNVDMQHFPHQIILEIENGLRGVYEFQDMERPKEIYDINGNITYSYTTI